MIDRREGHLVMSYHRRDDAHEIDIIASDERPPIAFNIWDAKLARNFFRMFAARARDCDDARIFTVFETGNLGGPGKACPNDPDANNLFHCFVY